VLFLKLRHVWGFFAKSFLDNISRGAFLTVKAGDALNTMTIGWALMGRAWRRPILVVMVRESRHTHGLMQKAEDFTVSLPTTDMKEALEVCGSTSGRDADKFRKANIKIKDARKVSTPIIDSDGFHFECRIVHKSPMAPETLAGEYGEKIYPQGDFHTLFFGEIVDCYEIE